MDGNDDEMILYWSEFTHTVARLCGIAHKPATVKSSRCVYRMKLVHCIPLQLCLWPLTFKVPIPLPTPSTSLVTTVLFALCVGLTDIFISRMWVRQSRVFLLCGWSVSALLYRKMQPILLPCFSLLADVLLPTSHFEKFSCLPAGPCYHLTPPTLIRHILGSRVSLPWLNQLIH